MKKLKKIISFTLAMLMLATLMSSVVPVSAETTNYFKIGETEYATLGAAVSAAQSGDVIIMLADYNTITENYDDWTVGSGKNITIDGQNQFGITGKAPENYFGMVQNGTLTIQNMTHFKANSGFYLWSKATLNFVNVDDITIDPRGYNAHPVVSANYDLATLNVIDSTLTYYGVSAIGMFTFASNLIVNITNSTMTCNAPGGYSGIFRTTSAVNANLTVENSHINFVDNDNDVFHVFDLQNASSVVNANFKSGSFNLTKNHTTAGTDAFRWMTPWGGSAGTCNIAYGEGFRVNIKSVANAVNLATHNLKETEAYKGTITNNGAIFTIDAATRATVTLPAITNTAYTLYVEEVTDTSKTARVVMPGTAFNMTEADTTAVTFKPGTSENAFSNVYGASIRTKAPYGIRFAARIDQTFYNNLKGDGTVPVKLGIVVAPTTLIENGNFAALTDENSVKIVVGEDELSAKDNYFELTAAIYLRENPELNGATVDQLNTKMSACAFYQIGNTIVWADYDEEANARSIYDVAKNYVTAEHNGVVSDCPYTFIQNIITACEANA